MYRITRVLSVGPFASPERAERLRDAGVTHVLNVSDRPSEILADGAIRDVGWVPMSDAHRLRPGKLVAALDALHAMVCEPNSHVYVHCVLGMVRSPTILWLYLIACGLSPEVARNLIENASPDATAGHPHMVSDEHVLLAQKHGLANYFPHPRGDVIVAFDERS